MNSIKVGKVYRAEKKKNGEDWELLVTRDEKGHNEMGLFVSNYPSGVQEGGCFRVTGIESVCLSNRQDEKGRWWPSLRINAEVETASEPEKTEEAAPRQKREFRTEEYAPRRTPA